MAYITKPSVGIVRSIVIEIVIIVILAAGVISILNYLKVINLGILFSKPDEPVVSVISSPVKNVPQSVSSSSASQADPAMPNLGAIFKSGALHSATTNFEFEASIVSLDANPGLDKKLKVRYAYRLVLQIGKEKQNVVLVYSKEAVGKVKVFELNNKEINFKDLKIGDKVIVKTELNSIRKYPGNYNSVVINKIS